MSSLGYIHTDGRCFKTQNPILLIFKFQLYKSSDTGNLSFSAFFHKHLKIKNLKKGAALRNRRKLDVYEKTWPFIENGLQSE